MPTYEMLWDCPYCGTRKLLGKTHRFCPQCGAPQDPEKRYFPSDADKVAVENHEYVGADHICPSCGAAMGARAVHCSQCGGSLDGAARVRLVDQAGAAPASTASTHTSAPAAVATVPRDERRGRAPWALGCLGVVVVGVALLLVAILWKRPAEVRVTGHTWERMVEVEALGPQAGQAWCDEMPRDARDVRRSREKRSHRRAANGEDCTTVKVDQGDGTYREEERCQTRYVDEPVYDDRCSFTVDRWTHTRDVRASGAGLTPAPRWPDAALRTGTCRGCERSGRRIERYRVQLRGPDGRTHECDLAQGAWAALADGASRRIRVAAITHAPVCQDLATQ